MYIDILPRLTDAARRKRPEKWRTSSYLLLHDNAPVHRSVLVKDFLATNNVTILEQRHYSSTWLQLNFTVPHMKPTLKGRCFTVAANILFIFTNKGTYIGTNK